MIENHPEWWVIGASSLAWVLMYNVGPTSVIAICSASDIDAIKAATLGLPVTPDFGTEFMYWLLMSVAMMLPLSVVLVRHVAFRSYAWRRHRAIALFVIGYLVVWAAAGAVIIGVGTAARSAGVDDMYLLAFCIPIAFGWQLTPIKSRALRRCHRTVAMSPLGWRADLDCLRFGSLSGGNCVASCWLVMATLLFGPCGFVPMALVQALTTFERYELLPGHPRFLLLSLRRAITRRFPKWQRAIAG